LPKGLSNCRICGKPIPSHYRKDHEKKRCVVMKARKGLLPPNHPYYKKLAEPPQKTLEKFLTT
jgi:hypothetical protein